MTFRCFNRLSTATAWWHNLCNGLSVTNTEKSLILSIKIYSVDIDITNFKSGR